MPAIAKIWTDLQSQIGAPDVLAKSIQRWFKYITVHKPRPTKNGQTTTIYNEVKALTTFGMPRFHTLPLETQRALKREVREQYTTLPSDVTTEELIEEAFDLIFKGKHQWSRPSGREENKTSSAEPETGPVELETGLVEPGVGSVDPKPSKGNTLSIKEMLS